MTNNGGSAWQHPRTTILIEVSSIRGQNVQAEALIGLRSSSGAAGGIVTLGIVMNKPVVDLLDKLLYGWAQRYAELKIPVSDAVKCP